MKFGIIKVESEDDLNACLEIREKVFIEEKGVPREIENDKYDCLRDDCEHFLVSYDGQPVGTVRVRALDDKTVMLQRFCFLRQCRGLGLGAKTVESIGKRCKNLGKTKIVVEAKYSASPFYEKCGFMAVSDIFCEVGVKHIKMEKEI